MFLLSRMNMTSLFVQLSILSLCFGGIYLNIGFALKPYIIVSVLSIILLSSAMKFSKLYSFESWLILFVLVYCFSAIQFEFPEQHIRFVFAFFIIFLFYFSMRGLILNCSVEELQKMISISGIIGGMASLIYYLSGVITTRMNFFGNGIVYDGLLLDRSVPRLIGTASNDPNIFVFFMTIYFFYYLYNLSSNLNKMGFIIVTLCIALTFSRGAYIALLITMILMFVISGKQKGRVKNFFFLTLLFLGIIYIASIFNVNFIEYVVDRFSDISTDRGSGRLVLWDNAIQTFINNPILGIGLNGTLEYNTIHYGTPVYIHNTMLEVLSESGIIGFIIFLILWVLIFHFCVKLFKINKDTKFLLAIFIAMFIQMLSLSILLNEAFYLMLLILYRYGVENFEGIIVSKKI